MEPLRNTVSGWSYCIAESVGGTIAQYGQWVELLRNRAGGWSYCVIESVGGVRVTGN